MSLKCPFRALRGGLERETGDRKKKRKPAANNQRENCINSRFSPFQRRAQKLFIIANAVVWKHMEKKSSTKNDARTFALLWNVMEKWFLLPLQDSFADAFDLACFFLPTGSGEFLAMLFWLRSVDRLLWLKCNGKFDILWNFFSSFRDQFCARWSLLSKPCRLSTIAS